MDVIYEETLPNALMIGVDYDLFWTLNPKSLAPFIKAFKLRQEYDDYVSWTNGMYIRVAIASVLSKDTKYPNKPYSRTASQEMTAEQIRDKMFEKMKQINSRFGKEEKNG